MCTNLKSVYNRYIKRALLVDCGKCPACQQQKANARANRIRNTLKCGQICLFVTLTYKNCFCPYIDTCELSEGINLDVHLYRDSFGRRQRVGVGSSYAQCFVGSSGCHVIDRIPFLEVSRKDFSHTSKTSLRHLSGYPSNKVGICWYPDVQNFYKRLRQNLKRKYNFYDSFKFFSCCEYGSFTQRPHFHLLIYISASAEQTFRNAIVESWPYADSYRTRNFIEVARDCASYVSSYVNGNSCFSKVLTNSFTKQRHSYSHGFGMSNPEFSLEKIQEKVKRGALIYHRKTIIDGVPTEFDVPIPKYVINRFFPWAKGFSRLSLDSLAKLLSCPERILQPGFIDSREFNEIGYTLDDYWKICTSLNNSYARYHSFTGSSRIDYVIDYLATWRCYRSTILRHSYLEVYDPSGWLCFYDNISEFSFNPDMSLSLSECFSDYHLSISHAVTDPNSLPSRVLRSHVLTEKYRRMSKQKNVTNYIMAEGLGLCV